MAEGRRIRRAVALAITFLCNPVVTSPGDTQQLVDPRERERVLRNYRRYQEAPEEQRREIERQYERWQQMPEEERRRILDNYERYRKLPREEQRDFKRKYERWREQRQR